MTSHIPTTATPEAFGGAGAHVNYDSDSEFGDQVLLTAAEEERRHAAYLHYHVDNQCHRIFRVAAVPKLVVNPDTDVLETSLVRTRVSISVFTTPEWPGAKIRDAITGRVFEGMLTGRSDELSFFKVRLATGELGPAAKSGTLFFRSAKEYERHFWTKCGELAASRALGAPRRIADVDARIQWEQNERLAQKERAQSAQMYTLVR